jgi:hypothetical protein
MNSKQYEELCRVFLADKVGIRVVDIHSVDIPNPRRQGLPEYKHQIDLYWETENEVALYLNIANAKWRGSQKVDQPDVLLLQKVKEKVGAHKAVMITNSEFTAGAVAAAQDEGIALHIVQPMFDYGALEKKRRGVILIQIQQLAATSTEPLYAHEIVFRAFDLCQLQHTAIVPANSSIPASNKLGMGFPNRMQGSVPNKSISPAGQGGATRQHGNRIQYKGIPPFKKK